MRIPKEYLNHFRIAKSPWLVCPLLIACLCLCIQQSEAGCNQPGDCCEPEWVCDGWQTPPPNLSLEVEPHGDLCFSQGMILSVSASAPAVSGVERLRDAAECSAQQLTKAGSTITINPQVTWEVAGTANPTPVSGVGLQAVFTPQATGTVIVAFTATASRENCPVYGPQTKEESVLFQIGNGCEPGSQVDVTLSEGDEPWDDPHNAWGEEVDITHLPHIQDIWTGLIGGALSNSIPLPSCPFGPTVWASLSKKFINKCCLDCNQDGCFEIGKYRYKSMRVNLNTPQSVQFPWSQYPQFQTFVQYAQTVINVYLEIDPDNPYVEGLSQLLEWAQGIEIPIQLLINDWVTNESDECIGCPNVCAGETAASISNCETGIRRVTVNFPEKTKTWYNFSATVQLQGMYEWKGSRVGLQNHRDIRFGGQFKLKLAAEAPIYGPVPLCNIDLPAFMKVLPRVTVVLCM